MCPSLFYTPFTLSLAYVPKRVKVTEKYRIWHTRKLHDFYSTPNVVRMNESWRLRWAGHVKSTGQKKNKYRVMVKKKHLKKQTTLNACAQMER